MDRNTSPDIRMFFMSTKGISRRLGRSILRRSSVCQSIETLHIAQRSSHHMSAHRNGAIPLVVKRDIALDTKRSASIYFPVS